MDLSVQNLIPLPGSQARQERAGESSVQSEFAALMSGADVGLALFDKDLRLLACNDLYRTLCDYREEETVPGTPFADLVSLSLRRRAMPEADIAVALDRALSRLNPGTGYTFRHSSVSGREVEINRRRLDTGALVETVREARDQIPGTELGAQFAQIADAARERMMHALDVMADGFALFDAQDRLVAYNRNYVKSKPNAEHLIFPGMTFECILRACIERGTYVMNGLDGEAYFAQRMRHHRNPGAPYEVQLTDGRWILVSEKRTPDGGTVGIRSDITQMKSRELDLLRISRKLHAKNSQFDVALNNMIQGLCMFDASQRLIVCNRRYLEIYGFSADVVKPGILLSDIMRYSVSLGNYTEEEAARALAERYDPLRLRERTTIKQRLKDGRVIAVMSEPMSDGGTIATYHDITESENQALALQAHALRLEASNRDLQEFAYVASHDLQEPLRKIEAFADRLVRKYGKTLPEDGQMFIERMQNAAGRMRQLIGALLSYSRVSTNASRYVDVDLNSVLSEVLSDLQIQIEEEKATIDRDPLPTIEADPTQMRQLLQNILSNALKFRRKDVGLLIEIRARTVADPSRHDLPSGWLELSVRDNGIGFDNAYKDQIFKIFQRLHGRMEYEGTGIGLATCRKIVDRHGGQIDADGRPGQGTTFRIRLPIRREQGSTDSRTASPAGGA
jgi:signal transduction histidine kinase